MGRTIHVNSAQVNAARLWIERANRDGRPVPDAIRKLADAKPRPILIETPSVDGLPDTAGVDQLLAREPPPVTDES